MAGLSKGLRAGIRVAKAIDSANKRAARDAERRRKQQEREAARQQREYEKMLRQQEKDQAAAEKALFKQELEDAKIAYDDRCYERQELRNEFVNRELR